MRIALYIEDGLEQIVLTPDSNIEENILRKLEDGSRELSIKRGKFYDCRGGWKVQGDLATRSSHPTKDESTMIILRPKPSVKGSAEDG